MKGNTAKTDKIKSNRLEVRPSLPQEARATAPITEGITQDLVRELRQPLSSIEAIAYYLEMTLPFDQADPRQHVRQIQRLVDETNSILRNAGADVYKHGLESVAAGPMHLASQPDATEIERR